MKRLIKWLWNLRLFLADDSCSEGGRVFRGTASKVVINDVQMCGKAFATAEQVEAVLRQQIAGYQAEQDRTYFEDED